MSKIALFILLFFILIRPVSLVFQNSQLFFSRNYEKTYPSLKKLYYSSQYVSKKPVIITDEALEAFAGGAFLKGLNPILIVHDQPPLGRYLIALSILFFDNPNVITLICAVLSTIGIFLITRAVFKNNFLSLIPLGLFMNEPLFLNKITTTPLLEPIQLPFIIFSIYFFIKGVSEKNYKKWLILTSIMLGFVMSTRFFILGAFLFASLVCFFVFSKNLKERFFYFILTSPLSILVLVLSYFRFIELGGNPFKVLGIQKYILFYHKSQVGNTLSFWDLILFNKWHTWWGNRSISFDPNWISIWPISTIITAIHLFFALFKKVKVTDAEKIIFLWIIFYSLLLSFGDSSTRYFLPLLPFIYILSLSFLIKIAKT